MEAIQALCGCVLCMHACLHVCVCVYIVHFKEHHTATCTPSASGELPGVSIFLAENCPVLNRLVVNSLAVNCPTPVEGEIFQALCDGQLHWAVRSHTVTVEQT